MRNCTTKCVSKCATPAGGPRHPRVVAAVHLQIPRALPRIAALPVRKNKPPNPRYSPSINKPNSCNPATSTQNPKRWRCGGDTARSGEHAVKSGEDAVPSGAQAAASVEEAKLGAFQAAPNQCPNIQPPTRHPRCKAANSASVISAINSANVVFGSQPRTRLALLASPTRWIGSIARIKR
jgi:hypothetical protein